LATARLLEQERTVFQSRKNTFDTQMKTLTQLKAYLQSEAESTDGQVATHARQIELLKQELDGVQVLAEKGLATAPRKLALERNLAELEGEDLRLKSAVVKVRQEISRTDIDLVQLEAKRSSDVATELQTTQFTLEQSGRKTDTANKLLYESEVVAPRLAADYSTNHKVEPRYKIVRISGGHPVEMDADEATALEPGDTVKVEVPSPPEETERKMEPNADMAPKRAALESAKRLNE
jgi:polysaccharide export outer membrane protein/exopolysaccharide production protein ExoF